jgi:hypothetical protein
MRVSDLILRSRVSGVSKDEATVLQGSYTTGERPPSTLMAVPVMNDP